jgi:hypothetical protein
VRFVFIAKHRGIWPAEWFFIAAWDNYDMPRLKTSLPHMYC